MQQLQSVKITHTCSNSFRQKNIDVLLLWKNETLKQRAGFKTKPVVLLGQVSHGTPTTDRRFCQEQFLRLKLAEQSSSY